MEEKHMQRMFASSVGLLLFVVSLVPAQERKADVLIERDVVYGKGGTVELQLDLARPKDGPGPFPTMLCVHGGGWRAGKRQDLGKTIETLAGRGYVAVTVSYRLAPAAQFPAQIEDCKAAVRWLRANAAKYKIDPEQIGCLGFSAGGHLVCLLGTAAKEDGLEGAGGHAEQSSRVQAVCSFFGPTDLTERTWTPELEKALLVPFVGGTFDEKPELYKKASPITYVRKGTPPFLFFHGTEDKLVSVRQSRILAEKLKSVGGAAKVVEYEGAGHGWGGKQLTDSIEEMFRFFDGHLKKTEKAK